MSNIRDTENVFFLNTELPVDFSIELSNDIFNPKNKDLLRYGILGPNARRIIIIDLKVSRLYLDYIKQYFKENNLNCSVVIIDATEETEKNDIEIDDID